MTNRPPPEGMPVGQCEARSVAVAPYLGKRVVKLEFLRLCHVVQVVVYKYIF